MPGTKLDQLVSRKVKELLNAMLDAEADEITSAVRYERNGGRKAYRTGHYERGLWLASNENRSYRPYRPKPLRTGPVDLGAVPFGDGGPAAGHG